MMPPEQTVNRLMNDTGMGRVQAISHLQQREEVQRRARERVRSGAHVPGWAREG